MAELVLRMTPLKCGHSVRGLDLITWTCCVCGAKEPKPPRGVKAKRQAKRLAEERKARSE